VKNRGNSAVSAVLYKTGDELLGTGPLSGTLTVEHKLRGKAYRVSLISGEKWEILHYMILEPIGKGYTLRRLQTEEIDSIRAYSSKGEKRHCLISPQTMALSE